MSKIWILLFLPHIAYGLIHRCPKTEQNSKCHCISAPYTVVLVCANMVGSDMLITELNLYRNFSFNYLVIRDSKDLNFYPKFFQEFCFIHIRIVNSEITNVGIFNSFWGLERTLEKISIMNCAIGNLSWRKGKRLQKVFTIEMSFLAGTFKITRKITRKYPTLIRSLTFSGMALKSIEKKAFKRFMYLDYLDLSGNLFTKFDRDILAKDAYNIRLLDLSNNRLVTSSLNNDSFAGMANLQSLNLSNNKIDRLPQGIFEKIWVQLNTFNISGLPLICDCSLAWISKYLPPDNFATPTCAKPEGLDFRTYVYMNASTSCKDYL